MENNNEEVLYLSVEEMKMIEDNFNEVFPDSDLTVIHQIESKIAHVDLCILYKKGYYSVIYTMGMSNFIMPDNTSCEIFVEVPNILFKMEPTVENCTKYSITDVLNLDYWFIIQDLLNIALMPSDGSNYLSGETIQISNRLYGLLEFFRKPNPYKDTTIKFMYLVQLSTKDLRNIQGNSRLDNEEYFSKLIGPIRKGIK